MQSICEHLLHEKYKKRRQLRRIKFVWVERDPVMMKQTDFIKRRANSLQTVQFNDSVNFSVKDAYGKSKPLAIIGIKLLMLPTSIMTDEEFASIELLLDDDITDEIETDLTEASAMYETASAFAKDDGPFHVERATLQLDSTAPLDPSPVLDMQVYLTAKAYSVKDIPFARLGRPNVKELFLEMKSEAIATGDKRVAVCVSAPRKFTALCRKASVMYSDDKVRFDFHSESTTL